MRTRPTLPSSEDRARWAAQARVALRRLARAAVSFARRAAAWIAATLRPGPRAGLYAFGKHPASADYLDAARLPPVPRALAAFDRAIRPALAERYVAADEPPRTILFAVRHGRGAAAVLAVPSRDRGDALTGAHRRAALLIGLVAPTTRAELVGHVEALLRPLLADLAALGPGDDEAEVYRLIDAAARSARETLPARRAARAPRPFWSARRRRRAQASVSRDPLRRAEIGTPAWRDAAGRWIGSAAQAVRSPRLLDLARTARGPAAASARASQGTPPIAALAARLDRIDPNGSLAVVIHDDGADAPQFVRLDVLYADPREALALGRPRTEQSRAPVAMPTRDLALRPST